MSTTIKVAAESGLYTTLTGIPAVHFPTNLQAAVSAGRGMVSILKEVVSLRRGPGKLTPNEYFYYRLWSRSLTDSDRRRFVGKQAQQPMHIACNDTGWYATAADKLLFHTLMAGAGLPRPKLLAVTGPARRVLPEGKMLWDEKIVAGFLRHPSSYPLFAKPIDGKYSLSVISAVEYRGAADQAVLHDGSLIGVADLARDLMSRPAGYVLQRTLTPDDSLRQMFGPRLWSVRVLVLLTQAGPVVHRAVAKIATGRNAADNFWRPGNMLGAIDLTTGIIDRVIQGTGAEMLVDGEHPDTGRVVTGTDIPNWRALVDLVTEASALLPAIQTQSWDIALTDQGPIPLEVNFGGDLNLSQLASGVGVLDDAYRDHLRSCGHRL